MTLQQDIETMLAEHLAPGVATKLAATVTKRVVQSVNADRTAIRDRLLAALNGSAADGPAPKGKGKAKKAAAPQAEGTRKVSGVGALRMPLLKRITNAEKRRTAGSEPQPADAYVLEHAQEIRDGGAKQLKSFAAEVKRLTVAAEKAAKEAKKQVAASAKAAKAEAKAAKAEAARAKKAAVAEKAEKKTAGKKEKGKGKKKSDSPAPNGASHTSGTGLVAEEALL